MVEVDRCFIPARQRRHIEIQVHGQQWCIGRYNLQERRIGKAQARERVAPCSIHAGDDGLTALFDKSTKRQKEQRALGFSMLPEQVGRLRQRIGR